MCQYLRSQMGRGNKTPLSVLWSWQVPFTLLQSLPEKTELFCSIEQGDMMLIERWWWVFSSFESQVPAQLLVCTTHTVRCAGENNKRTHHKIGSGGIAVMEELPSHLYLEQSFHYLRLIYISEEEWVTVSVPRLSGHQIQKMLINFSQVSLAHLRRKVIVLATNNHLVQNHI